MTRMLASVTNELEAALAVEGGADIIDLKNPLEGALGALPLNVIERIVAAVGGRRPVSATIGDLPMVPELLAERVRQTAATQVDIVKAGFFGHHNHEACIDAIRPLAKGGVRMVAVLFADDAFDGSILSSLSNAGFYGVMLDTSRKNGQRLTDYLSIPVLADFVGHSRRLGMVSGLAGSLTIADIDSLLDAHPDYLGFRGALCSCHDRTAMMELDRILAVREVLRKSNIHTAAMA